MFCIYCEKANPYPQEECITEDIYRAPGILLRQMLLESQFSAYCLRPFSLLLIFIILLKTL